MNFDAYYDLFTEHWENGRYDQAIEIYELTGRFFWCAEDVGRYYESEGLLDRAMAEYEFLIEKYMEMGSDFLPLPGGPVELYKLGRWYEKTDPQKAEKYLGSAEKRFLTLRIDWWVTCLGPTCSPNS